jgi:Alcohol dehydrogenase, class IV
MFQFFVKSDITFGRGAIEELPNIIKKANIKNAMIIYDEGVKIAGITEKVMNKILEANINFIVFDKVLPNPSNDLVEEAAVLANQKKADGFIAVGGGSSIDLAKAVNVLMTNPSPIEQYAGIGNVKNNVLPLIAIPTTAGTSSEITNVAALIDNKAVCKYVVIDNKITPTSVIIDPEFTKTMPKSVTAATGMDAITHAIESYISTMATPLSEYNSLRGLKILYDNLPKVVEDGTNMESREQMMLGCVITGFAFSNANLGLVHAIAHTLSAHFYLAHGMANATVLPYVVEFNARSCPEKMIEMAKVIELPVTGKIEKDMYLLSDELVKLTRLLGIKKLSEQGVQEKDLDMLAGEVLKEPVLNFNPRQNITKEQVLEIMKKAF